MIEKYEKEKYFIYNEDYKILTFCSVRESGFVHISFPGTTSNIEIVDATGIFYDSIINLLIEKENLSYINSTVSEQIILKEKNRKLIKTILRITRNYYSYYKEFSKADYENIIKLSHECNVLPMFFTIEELLELTIKNKKRSYDIQGIKEPLEELNKKLKFIKY